MRTLCHSLTLAACLPIAACAYVAEHIPGVYHLEIQQGNIIEQAMVNQLHPGMGKRQVLYVMGSPMLTDVFHPNRWEYVHYRKGENGDKQMRRLTLFFDNEQLAGVQGDFRPGVAPAPGADKKLTTLELPKRDLDRTLWQYLTGLFD